MSSETRGSLAGITSDPLTSPEHILLTTLIEQGWAAGQPLTLEQIRTAPKVMLHDHLDGGLRPSTVIELALRELEQAEFLRSVAAIEWDDEAEAEARAWDEAGSEDPIDPWDPHP